MFYDYPLRPRPAVPANGGTGAAGGAIVRTALIGTETTVSELRIGFRRLFRSPGYVAAAVLSLATGIAVCAAAFSLVNVMVFRDVAGIRDRRNLIRINWSNQGALFSLAELDVLEQLRPPALASVGAQADRALPVLLPSGPATLTVALVSARFFETLGT